MQNEKTQTEGEEISLKDIVDFLKRNKKLIVLCGFAGLLISSAYVILPPKNYEASWQMQVAQFSSGNSEEPAALVQRLRSPTAYTVEVQQQCGMPDNGEYGDYLNKKLEVKTIKDVANGIEMKFHSESPAQAMQCADAVVKMIMAQQRSLIEERLAERLAVRQAQLAQYQSALAEEQRQLEKTNKSVLGNLDFLAKLDKLRWLRTRIDALQEEALLSQTHPAKLIAPIYAPGKPIPRKEKQVLLLGISLGLMLGVLYALGREGWRKVA